MSAVKDTVKLGKSETDNRDHPFERSITKNQRVYEESNYKSDLRDAMLRMVKKKEFEEREKQKNDEIENNHNKHMQLKRLDPKNC